MTTPRPIILTPGVYFQEIDISQYIVNLTFTKLALVGVAPQGPVDEAILITSYQQALSTFGVPGEEYPALLVMREFFQAGGGICWFVRVSNGDVAATVTVPEINTIDNELFTAKTTGSFFNNISLQISYGNQVAQSQSQAFTFPIVDSFSQAHTFPAGADTYNVLLPVTPIIPGTLVIQFVATPAATDDGAGNLVFDLAFPEYSGTINYATGAVVINTAGLGAPNATTVNFTWNSVYTFTQTSVPLVPGTIVIKFGATVAATDNGTGTLLFGVAFPEYSGTVDYYTGDISIQAVGLGLANATTLNILSNYWGTYNLQVRYQSLDNQNNVINNFVLESFTRITPANAEAVLAASQYIILGGPPTTFPVAGNYPLSGGDDGALLVTAADYIGSVLGLTPTGLQWFAFPDQLDVNCVAIPLTADQYTAGMDLPVRQALIELCQVSRADTLCILDPPPGLTPQVVADWANGNNAYNTYNTVNSTYAAIYFPWIVTFNSITNDNDHTPPSAVAIQGLVRSHAWQAPAGPNRGLVQNIISIDYKLNPGDRAFLDQNRINSISNLNGLGDMILAQRTATLEASSLDRIGARRMLMVIEKAVVTALYPLLFEPNVPNTWNHAIQIVQPYLDSLVALQQIYYGKFQCDGILNTTQIINNNQMVAVVQIQPLKYAEIIVVSFLVEALGAQVTEAVASALTAF